MSVRSIGMSHWGLTGQIASGKADNADFESSLERDFYLLLEFDRNVARFEPQPCEIRYQAIDKAQRTYVPDVLVEYRRDFDPARGMPHELCEVKYRADLREHWIRYRPKFRAAVKYARERGWRFRIRTEVEIRTPYLANARFLLRYREWRWDEGIETALLDRMALFRETDAQTLVASFFWDPWKQAELLPHVWRLVATRQLGADLTAQLTMTSRIWTLGDMP